MVEFFYGPPGHTHNGGDQQHQIYNEVLGNFTSTTFVDFLARYPQAWRQEHSRPTPAVLDVQYNWDAYYKPFMRKIGGHTNTPLDPVGLRGFKAERGADGVVALMWKTKAESGEWRGADSQVGTPGFVILKGRPRGTPAIIPAKRDIMEKKYYKQLIGTKMTECLNAEGAPEARVWLAKSAKHGVIPVHRRLQEIGVVTPGALGSEVELKCGEVTAVVQLIEDTEATAERFWALPAEVERVVAEGVKAAEALSKKHRMHAAVGYANVKPCNRPSWEGSAAQDCQAKKNALDKSIRESNSEDDSEDDNEDDSEDDNEENTPIVVNNASRRRRQMIDQESAAVQRCPAWGLWRPRKSCTPSWLSSERG